MEASDMTPDSAKLFETIVEMAPDWSDGPPVFLSPAERGNLTHLKKLGLITTFEDEGQVWALFTEAGKDMAESLHGYRPDHPRYGRFPE